MAKRTIESLLVYPMATGTVKKEFGRFKVGSKFKGTVSTVNALSKGGFLEDIKKVEVED